MSDEAVTISSQIDRKGISQAQACLTSSADKRDKIIECDPRPVIPVIFLPGVMGTNLKKNDRTSAAAWAPPNVSSVGEIIDAITTLIGWWFRGAVDRQKRLNPKSIGVDNNGAIKLSDDVAGNSGLTKEEAQARGWGEVHKDSYHDILIYLQNQLNHPMLGGVPTGDWMKSVKKYDDVGYSPSREGQLHTSILMTSAEQFGANPIGPIIDEAALKLFARYQYPVHAVGYNWAQSNAQSASDVYARIQKICKQYQASKAIIVTHSMGGIVARGMLALFPESQSLIAGVVHGVQPATGAPIAAQRFRTGAGGFWSINGILFGYNDAEWTAVSANSPAALELMPMPDYRQGKPWWLIQNEAGENILQLPKTSAGRDLYASRAWYALIPEQNEALIDPAGIVKQDNAPNANYLSARQTYVNATLAATDFQREISGKYHPRTYAIFGEGPLKKGLLIPTESEKDLKTYGTVRWRGPLPDGTTEADLLTAKLVGDDHQGEIQIRVRGQVVTLKIQSADEDGDGTVPGSSAAAQIGASGVQQVFRQGGYEHQFSYNHPWSRWATLYGIAQISKSITPL